MEEMRFFWEESCAGYVFDVLFVSYRCMGMGEGRVFREAVFWAFAQGVVDR